jgi:hypothetical protein
MTTIKKAGARWFKRFQEKNRPPYRWYEYGTHVA